MTEKSQGQRECSLSKTFSNHNQENKTLLQPIPGPIHSACTQTSTKTEAALAFPPVGCIYPQLLQVSHFSVIW